MVLEYEIPDVARRQVHRPRRPTLFIDIAVEAVRKTELPKEVTDPIRNLNTEILAGFADEKLRPDVVLVLERSAVLPTSSLVRQINKDYPDTDVMQLPVSKVLPLMFGEWKEAQDPAFDGEEDLDLGHESQAKEFVAWLRETKDPTIKQMLTQIEELALDGKSILVLDDARASGETFKHTLPLVLQAVNPEGMSFETQAYFNGNFSWEKAVVANLGMDLSPAETEVLITFLKGTFDIRRFKMELESNFYTIPAEERVKMERLIGESYGNGEALLPVDSELVMKMTGNQAALSKKEPGKEQETDPAGSLLKKYSLEALRKLREEINKKFAHI